MGEFQDQAAYMGAFLCYPFNRDRSAHEVIRGYNLGHGQWDTVGTHDMPLKVSQWNEQAGLFTESFDGALSSGTNVWYFGGDFIAQTTVEFIARPDTDVGKRVVFSFAHIYTDPTHINGFEVSVIDGYVSATFARHVPGFDNKVDQTLRSTTRLKPGEWYHVHVVWSKQPYNFMGGFSIWINGVKDAEMDCIYAWRWGPQQMYKPNGQLASVVGVGMSTASQIDPLYTVDVDPHPFYGVLDEVTLYFYELSPENIAARVAASGVKGIQYMSERASVYEGSWWSTESTPGAGDGNLYRLLGTDVTVDPVTNIRTFRKASAKFSTSSSRGKEYSKGTVTGDQAFNDMLFLARGLMSAGVKSTPTKNGVYTITLGGATGGTFKVSINNGIATAETANLAYNISAGALKTAIENLATAGPGLVDVEGTGGAGFTVTLMGHLFMAALTANFGSLTGATSPAAVTTAATDARVWDLRCNTWGADDTVTYCILKGQDGVADAGARVKRVNISNLAARYSKDEASLSGDFFGDAMEEPYTIDADEADDLPLQEVDMDSVGVWVGKDLYGPNAPVKLRRLYTTDWGLGDKVKPNITIDDDSPSLSGSGGIESPVNATVKLAMQHNAQGLDMLQKLRNGDEVWFVLQAHGDEIEDGFDYRYVIMLHAQIVNVTHSDMDGAYVSNFDLNVSHDPVTGYAVRAVFVSEIDAF